MVTAAIEGGSVVVRDGDRIAVLVLGGDGNARAVRKWMHERGADSPDVYSAAVELIGTAAAAEAARGMKGGAA